MRRALNIPDSEVLIMMISVGYICGRHIARDAIEAFYGAALRAAIYSAYS